MKAAEKGGAGGEGTFEFAALTPERWGDLEALFGPERGAYGGCWCTWWRLGTTEFKSMPREGRRALFRETVERGPPPGVLAYAGGTPVGWCAVGPRATLPKLLRSRVAAPLDPGAPVDPGDGAVWMINCFYIGRAWRGRGLMRQLIGAAVDLARAHGAAAVEACPLDTTRKLVAGEGYVGIAAAFRDAGFREAARRSPTRPLMRLEV